MLTGDDAVDIVTIGKFVLFCVYLIFPFIVCHRLKQIAKK